MKYYLIKIDDFSNAFSIIESGKKVSFEYSTAIDSEILNVITVGDIVIGFRTDDYRAHMMFRVDSISASNKIVLKKMIDVSTGGAIGDELIALVGNKDLYEISEEQFKSIYNEIMKDLGGSDQDVTTPMVQDDVEKKELKNCLEIQRNPRQNAIYPLNIIIYGAPGTGKTYSTAEYALAIIENREADLSKKTFDERKAVMKKYNDLIRKGQIVFTTFHQSYGYEEFIQGLRPDTNSEKMSFKTVDGVFKHIADVALNDFENNYVIIIDEINRANISKVFGELITLIEEDKRWGEVNETCATLQSGDVFAVPNNLYIVGTMNSADKSISLIDAALRRRFEFIEQKPQPELIDNSSLKNVLAKMNSKLVDELDSSDLLIGHSYFMNKPETALPSILNNSIIPLLYEYFYDNKKKVASVLDYSLGDMNIEIIDDKMGRLSVKKKAE